MKRFIFIFIGLFCFLQGGESCPFCDSDVIDYQKYYEDDQVIGLCTHKPVTEGHCLIIPKRHVERFEDLAEEEELAINFLIKKTQMAASKALGKNSYLILQKNGRSVGQSIPHVHFHLIPRKEGDSPSLGFLLKFFVSSYFSPLSKEEMERITQLFINNIN